MNRTLRGLCLLCVFPAIAFAQSAANTLSAKERADGWRLLFDGKTAAGWRGYRQQTLPGGWKAIDGALTRVGQAGDIVTIDEFGDFELTLEWKLAPNGNSGVFYRVVEARTFATRCMRQSTEGSSSHNAG